MDTVVYSPVSTADNLNFFTESSLRGLKYHELLKLSHKHDIKKRWAKKDDLIAALLAIEHKKSVTQLEVLKSSNDTDEVEWKDGRELFAQDPLQNSNIENIASRSTFTINKPLDPRATYDLTSLTEESLRTIVSDRNSRLTFDIPKPPPRKFNEKRVEPSKIKMLTVPSVTGRLERKTSQLASIKQSPLKLSNKSIGIKKTKQPFSPHNKGALMNHVRAMDQTRKRLEEGKTISDAVSTKTVGHKKSLGHQVISTPIPTGNRRKSRSDDPEIRRRSTLQGPTATATRTPPPSFQKTKAVAVSGIKPITTGKVPNFAAIHQRQFQKMDSLDEYMTKKSDRVKKLFGTPTIYKPNNKTDENPRQQYKPPEHKENIFQRNKPSDKLEERKKMLSRSQQIRTQTEVKDKTRSHIHGIRMNRRFELQMKMRNLL